MTNHELFIVQHERYLLGAYSPLVTAAGFAPDYIAQLSGTDTYFLATAIMGQVKRRARVIVKGAFSETDYVGALRSMTAGELREMRSRINFRPLRQQ